jgi:heptosyltransferase-2
VWFTKQWEESSYRELVAELATRWRVFLIGGPDDRALCERVKGDTAAFNLAGELPLLASAALMEGAARVFVNDSGPLHLASAVDAPTTAFFCATIPQFGYGPLAVGAVVLETPEKLDCRPCGLHGGTSCPAGHFLCAKNVTVAMALGTLDKS